MANPRKEADRAYKKARYDADPEWAAKVRARSKAYGARPEVRERRKRYIREYQIDRKKNHPEWVEAERARGRAKQRKKREELRKDPVAYAAFLEKERQKKAGIMREVKVEQELVAQVEALGGFCPKWIDTSRRGAPDRIVMLPGRPVIFVELKRPVNGTVSSHQRRYHRDIQNAGQRVIVLRSIPEVYDFLFQFYLETYP